MFHTSLVERNRDSKYDQPRRRNVKNQPPKTIVRATVERKTTEKNKRRARLGIAKKAIAGLL